MQQISFSSQNKFNHIYFFISGDNWSVTCPGKFWRRDDKVRLKHVVTESYLHVSGDQFGRPIAGQKEVSSFSYAHENNLWKAAEGIFVKPLESSSFYQDMRDEL